MSTPDTTPPIIQTSVGNDVSFLSSCMKGSSLFGWKVPNFKETITQVEQTRTRYVESVLMYVYPNGEIKLGSAQSFLPVTKKKAEFKTGVMLCWWLQVNPVVTQDGKQKTQVVITLGKYYVTTEPSSSSTSSLESEKDCNVIASVSVEVTPTGVGSTLLLQKSSRELNQRFLKIILITFLIVPYRFEGVNLSRGLFFSSEKDKYLDQTGTLNLYIEFCVYISKLLSSGNSRPGGEDIDMAAKLLLDDQLRGKVMKTMSELQGDEKTSDTRIIIKMDGVEMKRFNCHSTVLSANSSVFEAMLNSEHGMTEQQNGEIEINDISAEVMEQFLNFLYIGRLREKRGTGKDQPTWIQMLPELVYVADKYDVKGLQSFCDLHLHRALRPDNAIDLFKLANRHGLKRAELKLKTHLAKNVDILLNSILK